MYSSIRIEREANKIVVSATDPKIEKANRARDRKSDMCEPWRDPSVKHTFDTKDQAIEYIGKIFDAALPKDEYSSEFDKLAKEAQKS